jgi:hypothetical protein
VRHLRPSASWHSTLPLGLLPLPFWVDGRGRITSDPDGCTSRAYHRVEGSANNRVELRNGVVGMKKTLARIAISVLVSVGLGLQVWG